MMWHHAAVSDGRYPAGQTALLARVDPAQPLVEPWRLRYDPAAASGVPAHVTVLYPFLHVDRLDAATLDELATLFGRHATFTAYFEECRRFPGVLYLAPRPEQRFRALTGDVATRWPEAPPYEGRFADVIPHLTVADGTESDILDEIEAALVPGLPVVASISSVSLFVCDGQRWHERTRFPLRA